MGRIGTRRLRPRWLVVPIAVALIFLFVRALDQPAPIFYYHVVDDRTLIVGSVTGSGTWTRIVSVSETESSITVSIGSLRAPLPGTGGEIVELTVRLQAPLGERSVIDGRSGVPVPRDG